jgi:diguanylate cyclase (GGDEF)-like protein
MPVIPLRRIAAIVIAAVLLIGGSVFAGATIARVSTMRGAQQQTASALMLSAMLNQETGARGYFETRDSIFLQPYVAGISQFAHALATSRRLAGSDSALKLALNSEAQIADTWNAGVQRQITRLRNGGRAPTLNQALTAKSTMDGFRSANLAFDAQLAQRRQAALSSQTWWAVAIAAGVSVLLAIVGSLLARAAVRRESSRLKRQRELRELLEASESEHESQMLLIRHIERTTPGSAAAVFNRNNSDNRLEPVLGDGNSETTLLGLELEHVEPRSCMAVRLSRPYVRRPGDEPLMRCEVCGKVAGDVTCEPLLVGGRVIGSVLVARQNAVSEQERSRVRDAVVQAAPILANQRNLALAELRAASDALTGLPNRRAADETLKRMAAHASRRVSPLAAILLDLDHFKQINDVHGHDMGDQALAAVGQILNSMLRTSDFAARYGGEEFLVLLPDTDRATAVHVAETVRCAIEQAAISHVGTLTASFGVAAIPDDTGDSDQLIRKADRALYSAKAGGRNRVETTVPGSHEIPA